MSTDGQGMAKVPLLKNMCHLSTRFCSGKSGGRKLKKETRKEKRDENVHL